MSLGKRLHAAVAGILQRLVFGRQDCWWQNRVLLLFGNLSDEFNLAQVLRALRAFDLVFVRGCHLKFDCQPVRPDERTGCG